MRTLIIAIFVFVFGLIGGVVLAIALNGTNLLLPGLGLVISGALLGFIIGVFCGVIFGLIIGFIVSRRLV
jgi:hypothetical protein